MTSNFSFCLPGKLRQWTFVAGICLLSTSVFAENATYSPPTLREQLEARSRQLQDSTDKADFFADWFDDLAEAEENTDTPAPSQPKPLHGGDDTFFPVDDTEGRIPASRLQNLLKSVSKEITPTGEADDSQLEEDDWKHTQENIPLPYQPTTNRKKATDQRTAPKPIKENPPLSRPKNESQLAPLIPTDEELLPQTELEKIESADSPDDQTDTTVPISEQQPELAPPTANPEPQPVQPAAPAQASKREVDLYSPEAEIQREGYPDRPDPKDEQKILINFNNVDIIEFIRFVSRQSGKNFIFDENELYFNVTIISEEPTTINNIMTALLQELRIHGLTMMEQGNNVIIYPADGVNAISKVVDENGLSSDVDESEIITQVFRLNTTDAPSAAVVIKPLTSDVSIIDVLENTNHLIVTDIASNVRKISQLIKNIDSPKSGLVIGQYVVKNDYVDSITDNAKGIMAPLAGDQSLTMVPHFASNSVFIIGSPYLVDRSIQIMRYLDQNQGATRLLDQTGRWILDDNGQWIFRTDLGGNAPPEGGWVIDEDGNWIFKPGQDGSPDGEPEGFWELDENGNWIYRLKSGSSIAARKLDRPDSERTEGLPVGHIEKAQFTIYKLKYRKGDQVSEALRNIGESLQDNEALNQDFINSINTVQWIESSNSLIFTGTPMALVKVIEFIEEIDVPLRQVFIEMLILDMTLTDSLNYGVNWGTQLGGGNVALGESFVSGVSQINNFLNSADVTASASATPTVAGLAQTPGYRLGVIGQHLTRCGVQFDTITALVKATHQDEDTRIIMNPKVFTEENYAAELFVGLEVQYPTQSIANDFGNVITQNFESKDIGTRLKVTPIIGNNNVITLDVFQEISNVAGAAVQAATLSSTNAGRTTTKSTTNTRVHVPNGFFVVISGEIRNEDRRQRDNVPCLGGVPFIGGLFAEKNVVKTKRNLVIFMRPQIVDTEEQMDKLTKRQQDVWRDGSYQKDAWEYEVDEALDLLNLKTTMQKRYDGCYNNDH